MQHTHTHTHTSDHGPKLRRLHRLIGTAIAALALAPTPLAAADPPDPRPVTLIPAPVSAPGGISTAAVNLRTRYLCSGEGTLRNVTDGFVLGWCRNGWPIDISAQSPRAFVGWAYGNYDGCGWIYGSNTGSSQPGYRSTCPDAATSPERGFMSFKNLPSGSNDVTTVPTTARKSDCAAYLNTRPWAGGGLTDYVGTIPRNRWLGWRYRTRTANAYLVRTDAIAQNWVFVASSCFQLPSPRVGPQ